MCKNIDAQIDITDITNADIAIDNIGDVLTSLIVSSFDTAMIRKTNPIRDASIYEAPNISHRINVIMIMSIVPIIRSISITFFILQRCVLMQWLYF